MAMSKQDRGRVTIILADALWYLRAGALLPDVDHATEEQKAFVACVYRVSEGLSDKELYNAALAAALQADCAQIDAQAASADRRHTGPLGPEEMAQIEAQAMGADRRRYTLSLKPEELN